MAPRDELGLGVAIAVGVVLGSCLVQPATAGGEAWQLVAIWGSGGGGTGQFRTPEDLALDDDENVYVADTGNDRIQVFSSDGQFRRTWGQTGTRDGEFLQPNCIAVDGEVVYVAEGTVPPNCRVQRFSLEGAFLNRWGSCSGPGSLQGADGMSVATGLAYVSAANWVHKFDAATGTLLDRFPGEVSMDVKVAQDGTIWVLFEIPPRVVHYAPDGQVLGEWSTLLPGEQGSFPWNIALDDRGHIYVTETVDGIEVLKEFTPDGVLQGRMEIRILQQGYAGRGLALVGSDTLYIVSESPSRVLKYVRGPVVVEETTWGRIKASYQGNEGLDDRKQ